MRNRPIGLLDSGVGGLTVLKATQKQLPDESFIYIGDTARCPYGNKTKEEIIHYTLELAHFLVKQNVKLIVIACNTATAQALDSIRKAVSVPVIGVISPGSFAAVNESKTNEIGLLATQSTVESGFYEESIKQIEPQAEVHSLACPSFVTLVEKNEYQSEKAKEIVEEKLADFKKGKMDTIILGCTHFPLLTDYIQETVGEDVKLIDSGALTSREIKKTLEENNLLAKNTHPSITLYTTRSPELFQEIARDWLDDQTLIVKTVSPERLKDLNEKE